MFQYNFAVDLIVKMFSTLQLLTSYVCNERVLHHSSKPDTAYCHTLHLTFNNYQKAAPVDIRT